MTQGAVMVARPPKIAERRRWKRGAEKKQY
jgi:hypothetical protein